MWTFEWDDEKAERNEAKHGTSFAEGSTCFYDQNALELYDPEHSKDEDRFLLLRRSDRGRVLVVSFTEREEETLRLISVRPATHKEEEQYFARII